MRLLTTIGGASHTPLLEGSTITLRRPVSSARLRVDDFAGVTTPPTMLDEVVVKINNDLLWSEDLTQSVWIKADVSVNAVSGVYDPIHGIHDTTQIVESGTVAQHFIYQRYLGETNSENVVWSAYLKALGATSTARLTILQRDHVTTHTLDVNLDTGSTTTGGSGTGGGATDMGDGWWRVYVTGNTGSGSNDAQGYVFLKDGSSYLGDGASGVHCWAPQWQSQQSVLAPYSPTLETSTIFDGFVVALDIQPNGKPPGRVFQLDCADWNWRLDNPPDVCTKVYANQSDQSIIIDALAECGLDSDITATTSTVASLETGITIAFDGATMREVLDEMGRISDGVFWIQNRTLYWNSEASVGDSIWEIDTESPAPPASWDVEALTVKQRHDFPLNSVEVVGAVQENGTRPSATDSDATSIAAIGTYHKKIEVQTANTASYAALVAAQLVAAGKDPTNTISFKFADDGGRRALTSVHRLVTATSTRFGLSSDDFIVREVGIRQIDEAVSEFSVTAGDYQPSVTDIMRRLEAATRSGRAVPQSIGALDFDAASSEAVDSTSTSLTNIDLTGDLSITATIRVDSISADRTICALDDGSNRGLVLSVTSFGLLSLTRTRASSSYFYSRQFPGGFSAGNVYRIVVTSPTATAARFWVNGVEATTGGGGSVGSGAFDAATSSPFRVGRDNGGAYMDGAIGSVAVWSVDLPETTALGLHNVKFSALPFSNYVELAWALDEFSDGSAALGTDSIIDRSSSGYHGTPSNTPTGTTLVYIAG